MLDNDDASTPSVAHAAKTAMAVDDAKAATEEAATEEEDAPAD